MVTYEVTALVESGLVEAYERYMRHRHISDVLASGCFSEAVFSRAAPGRYRVRYEALSEVDLERYLAMHAPRLREEFASQFLEGVTVSRELWVALQSWTASPR